MTILDQLAQWMGCTYVSDLRYLDRKQRQQAVRLLADLPRDAVSPGEWEAAFFYLAAAEEKTQKKPRTQIEFGESGGRYRT